MSLNLFSTLVGESPVMHNLYLEISSLAQSDCHVLLLGESATGKDSAAFELHCESPRGKHAFVVLNCAATPADLIEIEIFGHAKGAFSGALTAKQGRLGLADGGTLFLDDIDHIPIPIQLKLFNALLSKSYYPVGSSDFTACDVRLVVGATSSLKHRVDEGYFLAEFYSLFKSSSLFIPALRERTEDLASLFQVLFSKVLKTQHSLPVIDPVALEALENYDWPGNLRELECLVEALAEQYDGGIIYLENLPERYQQSHSKDQLPIGMIQDEMAFLLSSNAASLDEADCQIFFEHEWHNHEKSVSEGQTFQGAGFIELPHYDLNSGVSMKAFMQQVEIAVIAGALQQTAGNVSQAAKQLQINRTTLVEKIRKHGLRG